MTWASSLSNKGPSEGVLNLPRASVVGSSPSPLTRFFIAVIRLYQAALRPFLGPACRFEPSCSQYAEEALRLHGPLQGTRLAVWRICRCHPFSTGGLDPVPDQARQG